MGNSGEQISKWKGIGGVREASDFSIDVSTTLTGMLHFFQQEYAASLGKNKTITLSIEWSRCTFWFIVMTLREAMNNLKGNDSNGCDRSLTCAIQHNVCIAISNSFVCIANCIKTTNTTTHERDPATPHAHHGPHHHPPRIRLP